MSDEKGHAPDVIQAEAKGAAAAGNETEVEKVEYEEVTKTRKKTLRLPLQLSGPGFTMPKMTPEQLKVRMSAASDHPPILPSWWMIPCEGFRNRSQLQRLHISASLHGQHSTMSMSCGSNRSFMASSVISRFSFDINCK